MTGLDPSVHRITEMAVIVTDSNLNVIAKGPEIIVHQSDEVLDNMSEWCQEHFGGDDGLTKKVRDSSISTKECEEQVLKFVQQYTKPGQSPLCGNSIGQDKRFLANEMPAFYEHLHYRIIDVSTVKELARRWYPKLFKNRPKKKLCHRAMDDIEESIEELRWYRENVFRRFGSKCLSSMEGDP